MATAADGVVSGGGVPGSTIKDVAMKSNKSVPTLFEYQETGVKWFQGLYSKRQGGILGDDMGLGKTIQALSFLEQTREIEIALVLCPLSLLNVWEQEAKTWAPRFKTICLRVKNKQYGGKKRAELALQKKFSSALFRQYITMPGGEAGTGTGDLAGSNSAAAASSSSTLQLFRGTATSTGPKKKNALLFVANLDMLIFQPELLQEIKVQHDLADEQIRFLFKKRIRLLEKHAGDDFLQDFGALDPDEEESDGDDSVSDEDDAAPDAAQIVRGPASTRKRPAGAQPFTTGDSLADGGSASKRLFLDPEAAGAAEQGDSSTTARPGATGAAEGATSKRMIRLFRPDSTYDWDVVLVDEAHRCKEAGGTLSRNLRKVKSVAKFLITGTPLQNEVRDLWNLHDTCNPGILGNLQSFQKNFARPINRGMLKDAGELDVELKNVLSAQLQARTRPYFLHRTKKEVRSMGEVTKTDAVLWLRPCERQVEGYRKILENASFIAAARESGKMGTDVFRAITYLKKLSNSLVLCHPDFAVSGNWVEYCGKLNDEAAELAAGNVQEIMKPVQKEGAADGQATPKAKALPSSRVELEAVALNSPIRVKQDLPEAVAVVENKMIPNPSSQIASKSARSDQSDCDDEFFDADSGSGTPPVGIKDNESDDEFLSSGEEEEKAAVRDRARKISSPARRRSLSGEVAALAGAAVAVAAPDRPGAGPRRSSLLGRGGDEDADELKLIAGAIEKADSISKLREDAIKLGFLADFLPTLIKQNHKILLFSNSTKMLDLVMCCVLKPLKIKCLRIDGTTDVEDRNRKVQRFQSEKSQFTVFLATTKVGGVGLTLTAADRVVIMDPSWNPSVDHQAVDRSFRVGQFRDVVAYRLIATGFIEEKMFRYQVFKQGLAKSCLTTTAQAEQNDSLVKLAKAIEGGEDGAVANDGAVPMDVDINMENVFADGGEAEGAALVPADERDVLIEEQTRYFSHKDIRDLFEFLEPTTLDTCKKLEKEHGRAENAWGAWLQDSAAVEQVADGGSGQWPEGAPRPLASMDDDGSSEDDDADKDEPALKRRKIDEAKNSEQSLQERRLRDMVLGVSDYNCLFGKSASMKITIDPNFPIDDKQDEDADGKNKNKSPSLADKSPGGASSPDRSIEGVVDNPLGLDLDHDGSALLGHAKDPSKGSSKSSLGAHSQQGIGGNKSQKNDAASQQVDELAGLPLAEKKRILKEQVTSLKRKVMECSLKRQQAEREEKEAAKQAQAADAALKAAVEAKKQCKLNAKTAKDELTASKRQLEDEEKWLKQAEKAKVAAEKKLNELKKELEGLKTKVEQAKKKEEAEKKAAEESEKKMDEHAKNGLIATEGETTALEEVEQKQVELEFAETTNERTQKRVALERQIEVTKGVLKKPAVVRTFEKGARLMLNWQELRWKREEAEKKAADFERTAVPAGERSVQAEEKKVKEAKNKMEEQLVEVNEKTQAYTVAVGRMGDAEKDEEDAKKDVETKKAKVKEMKASIKERRDEEKRMEKESETKSAAFEKLEKKFRAFEEKTKRGMRDLVTEEYDEKQTEKMAKKK
mmetsp:Transcript_19863/g.50089  ORF Transcript_19863/g.50089 Transcript_19863/m.50089 type:complete len:1559 (-) Transcript_19863:878-5554(-)